MVETHISQRPYSQGRRFLTTGETLQVLPVKETGPPRSSLEDKDIIIVDDGTDEAAITPVGGSAVQVGAEQIAIGGRRRLAQRSRDAAGSGPIRLRHYRAQFPVEVWRRRPGEIHQDEKMLTFPTTGGPWRWSQGRSTRHSIFHACAAGDMQLGDYRLNLKGGAINRVHLIAPSLHAPTSASKGQP
jgi:hypothetical protein